MITQRAAACLTVNVLALSIPHWASAQEPALARTVRITAAREGLPTFGAGFVIQVSETQIYIVTASHVVEGDKSPRVEFYTRRNSPVSATVVEIEGGDPRGLALLVVDGDKTLGESVQSLPLAPPGDLTPGQQLLLVGMPRQAGSWSAVTVTFVNQRGRDIVFAPGVEEGYSGGPVLKDGQVVGLATSKEARTGRAASAGTIRDFVTHLGVDVGAPITVADCSAQIPVLQVRVKQSPGEYATWRSLLDCYDVLDKEAEYIQTVEQLLNTEVAFKDMDNVDRTAARAELHLWAGVHLMSEESEGQERDYLQRAKFHTERARVLGRNSIVYPVSLFVLGLISAQEIRTPPPTVAEIQTLYSRAKEWIDTLRVPPISLTASYYYWYGRALSQLEAFDQADAELQAGLAYSQKHLPDHPFYIDQFLLRLGTNAWRRGQNGQARRYWARISASNQEAIPQSLQVAGVSLWAESNHARLAGREKEANEKLQEAADIMSEAERAGASGWRFLLSRGTIYFALKDYSGAASDWRRCADMSPNVATCHYFLGRAYANMEGKGAEALSAYRRAAELEPDDEQSHSRLGESAMAMDSLALAARAFARAIELKPAWIRPYVSVATALIALSQQQPRYGDSSFALAESALRFSRAGLRQPVTPEQRDDVDSLKVWTGRILNSLAYSYAESRQNLDLGIEYINEALGMNPGAEQVPYFLDTKAWLLVLGAEKLTGPSKERQYSQAQKLLNDAISGLKDDKEAEAESVFHLGYIAQRRGKTSEASQLYLRALRLSPEYQPAKKALNELPK